MGSQQSLDLHESAVGPWEKSRERERKDIDMQMIVLNFIERVHLS